ncbi:MAG: hypothetical protein HS116_02165 [Planctomycetes bacterium]|nr:hypothetical protein [Planctomycetota bacterium]
MSGQQTDAKAKADEEAKAKKEADEKAKQEAEAKKAEEKAKKEADAKAKKEAQERAKAGRVDVNELKLDLRTSKYIAEGIPNPVRATQIKRAFFVRTPEGIRNGEPGDWLVIHNDGTRVVISDKTFQTRCKPLKS